MDKLLFFEHPLQPFSYQGRFFFRNIIFFAPTINFIHLTANNALTCLSLLFLPLPIQWVVLIFGSPHLIDFRTPFRLFFTENNMEFLFMAQISTSDFRAGLKVEMDSQPYVIVTNQFVKPGKGQAFNRVRLKHLINGKTLEKTFKSGETLQEADVQEEQMRLLYVDQSGATFMHDETFEQIIVPKDKLADVKQWLVDDLLYTVIVYKGEVALVEPPMFMELEIAETAPGVRGDTASGRVLKPATTTTGATVQVPIFLDQGEVIRIDTRTGEYVSRVNK